MGNNQAYAIFERLVIDTYDQGKLDKELLTIIMESFRGQDVDHGGTMDITTKDHKDADEVAVEVWGLTLPPKPARGASEDESGDFYDTVFKMFCEVKKEFDWW